MSLEVDHSRRLRSGRQASPALSPRQAGTSLVGGSSSGAGMLSFASASKDVFGDITAPMRNASPGGVRGLPSPVSGPRGVMPASTRKGKGIAVDYGDRFIPTRDGSNMHAAYQLLPDGMSDGARSGRRRKSNVGQGTDVEARREEVNATFSQILKEELFSPSRSPSRTASPANGPRPSPSRHSQIRRPMTFDNSHIPNLPSSRYQTSSAGTTPLHHHPPPAVSGVIAGERGERGERELSPASTLPPLPMHAPATPTSGHAHDRAPGAGPSGSHHRAHQSQVALTSSYRGGGAGPGGGPASPPTSSDRRYPISPPALHAPESPATPSKKRLLNFSSPASSRMAALTNGLDSMEHERYSLSPVGRRSQDVLLSPRKTVRQISRTPFKVLDAPELADDFYLNLVSWSNTNVLGVGLNSCVYLWSAKNSRVTKLCDLGEASGTAEEVHDAVTGLEWSNKGSNLAIGTSRGTVEIWDAEYCKLLRTMTGHTARVGSLAWNGHILSTGSRDRTILHRDVRVPDQYIRKLSGHHKQEVCGLKWNTATNQLASGGNDNKLYVWGGTDSRPTWRFGEHRAAVKAIAWSPHQRGVLASGGGTADKKIRFWNSLTGGLVSELDTGSQVCNLMWSLNSNEIVSTHGYSGGPVQNQIHIWRYPSMTQVATLTGHTFRVLYLAMSPDGQTIVTGAGDETLRFWNAFQRAKGEVGAGLGAVGAGAGGAGGGAGKKGWEGMNPFVKIR